MGGIIKMRNLAEIDADIAQTEAELKDVHGTSTEVYARIVGYYRSVRNWNKGKREEYNHRKLFVPNEDVINEHLPKQTSSKIIEHVFDENTEQNLEGKIRFELFVRKTCPNCPPVKDYCSNLPIEGSFIDVDSQEGFDRASALGVYSAPTVIFFNENNIEIARSHTLKELKALSLFEKQAEPALAFC